MDCVECNLLLSSFMDNELDPERAALVREHLAFCDPCAKVCEELAAILDVCKSSETSGLVPPNSKALWCRINNIIESELKPEPLPPPEGPRRRFWKFTLPQLSAAVACIALVSSLLTVVAIRNYTTPPDAADLVVAGSENRSLVERLMTKVGLVDSPQKARERRIAEQQAAIDYWTSRVQQRREMWDARMREAFDKNLYIMDESVHDYTLILQQNPDDEITSEMLNSVLDEKMEMLRRFSDL
jgi:hypothetical protein